MSQMDVIGMVYAATVFAGGLIGYLKAGSKPSLAAGAAFGLVAGAAAAYNNDALMLGTSAVLAGVMGSRFYKSGKLMPAGMVAALSALVFSRAGYRLVAKYAD